MTRPITAEDYADLVDAARSPGFKAWLAMAKSIGGCAEPIHLWGQSTTIHTATGQILTQRDIGRLLVACGNRRSSRCQPCSEIYRADTYQLIRAGLLGGKSVPETVIGHPKVFATFTAPSFGPVHHRPVGSDGKPRRCHPFGPHRCGQIHSPDDPALGQPLDLDTYDYVGAVLWNGLATKLWARTVQLINRSVAAQLGVAQRHWPHIGRVSVAKVAEYQARGVVHFHAVIRIDGPEQSHEPPSGATVEVLCQAIERAAATAVIVPPACSAEGHFADVVWGEQLDIRPISNTEGKDALSDGQVAGYVAKYATKGAEASGTIDRPIACRDCAGLGQDPDTGHVCPRCKGAGSRHALNQINANPHARAMIETCWRLGGHPALVELRLRPWAHMLGFRGHFSTKTRRYSVTLGCLRKARQTWRQHHTLKSHDLDPDIPFRRIRSAQLDDLELDPNQDTVLVIGAWSYAGRGHSPGQAIFAATIAADRAEDRRLSRQATHDEWEAA